MLLGAIADDLTGATDLSLMLSREGMRTIQVIGVPPSDFTIEDADTVVVALKSRTNPADEAKAMSRPPEHGRFCLNIARHSIRRPRAISVRSLKH